MRSTGRRWPRPRIKDRESVEMLDNFYIKNGLVFWTEEEIKLREWFVAYIQHTLSIKLLEVNQAFKFVRIEAPLLTPASFVNPTYTSDDVFAVDDLILRPETTMGSYAAASHLLGGYGKIKYRPPIVV
jgi:hypothetical protein